MSNSPNYKFSSLICIFYLAQLNCIAATTNDPVASEYEAIKAGKETLNQFRANLNRLRKQESTIGTAKTEVEKKTTEKTAAAIPKTENSLEALGDFISIRKSFLSADDEKEPAQFSWTKPSGESSFYTLDVALMLRGHSDGKASGFSFLGGNGDIGNYRIRWNIKPTFEAHVSTESKNSQDSLSSRLPITLSWYPHSLDSTIKEWFLTVSPVYEFDKVKKNESIGGDAFLTANIPVLGIGEFLWLTERPTPRKQPSDGVVFHWRPYLGFEGGHVIEAELGTPLSDQNEYARFASKFHAELAWVHKRTAPADNEVPYANRLVVSADYYLRQDFEGMQQTHSFVEVSPTYYFDESEHFSMGLTYKYGETTPKFSPVDSLNIWLGIKF